MSELILSIQSHVAYGHVGNDAAVFPMQRLGAEVIAVHTVQFSNHTGYGAWTGEVFEAQMIADIVRGVEARGVLGLCDGILSGYMGSAEIGAAILDAALTVRSANPGALYCCDPVMGDVGSGVFVRPEIPEMMRAKAMAEADIVTPNQFELSLLTGLEIGDRASLFAAVRALHAMGPKIIMVTSVLTHETPEDAIDCIASDGTQIFMVRTPRLSLAVNGAGDAISALFFLHWLRDHSAGHALAQAVSSIFGILKRTEDEGSREILLIPVQDELVHPTHKFKPELIAS
jgi:pyridoxine kinase